MVSALYIETRAPRCKLSHLKAAYLFQADLDIYHSFHYTGPQTHLLTHFDVYFTFITMEEQE